MICKYCVFHLIRSETFRHHLHFHSDIVSLPLSTSLCIRVCSRFINRWMENFCRSSKMLNSNFTVCLCVGFFIRLDKHAYEIYFVCLIILVHKRHSSTCYTHRTHDQITKIHCYAEILSKKFNIDVVVFAPIPLPFRVFPCLLLLRACKWLFKFLSIFSFCCCYAIICQYICRYSYREMWLYGVSHRFSITIQWKSECVRKSGGEMNHLISLRQHKFILRVHEQKKWALIAAQLFSINRNIHFKWISSERFSLFEIQKRYKIKCDTEIFRRFHHWGECMCSVYWPKIHIKRIDATIFLPFQFLGTIYMWKLDFQSMKSIYWITLDFLNNLIHLEVVEYQICRANGFFFSLRSVLFSHEWWKYETENWWIFVPLRRSFHQIQNAAGYNELI